MDAAILIFQRVFLRETHETMDKATATFRIQSLRELDALVGEHITGETPEIYWEDAHAHFRFESEDEAVETLKKFAKQMNLPVIDWDSMTVVKVKSYRPYSTEITAAWIVVEKLGALGKQMKMWREHAMWHVAFGGDQAARALSSPLAICAAALRAKGVEVGPDLDRLR
jgi:hypothetical protein